MAANHDGEGIILRHPRHGDPIAVYDYQDANGNVVLQVARFEHQQDGQTRKTFLQRDPRKPDGQWGLLPDTPRPLYRLPKLLAHMASGAREPIYIAEGEKDVHAIEAAGGVATTNAGGAGKFLLEHAETLAAARNLIIIVDRDQGAGARHAANITDTLGSIGYAGNTELVQAREGKDAADHLAAGYRLGELDAYYHNPDPTSLMGAEIGPTSIKVVPIAAFIAVDEPGSAPLVGLPGAVLIPENGDVMLYGDGGAGKTTLAIDFAYHLAAGDPWIGIPVNRPVRVLLVENEGPRPLFRDKLRRKHEAWAGSGVDDRLSVIESPWGRINFSDAACRPILAQTLSEHATDILIVGPLTRSGMNEAGTLQDTRDFTALVDEVRRNSGRHICVILIHHEAKSGQVSGAWEGAGDTLFHVQGQGHGRTRLFIQKARWSTLHHQTAIQLVWADGEGFDVEERELVTDETIGMAILDGARDHPGISWSRLRESVKGKGIDVAKVRDRLIKDGQLVNTATRDGYFKLWLHGDPSIAAESRSRSGTGWEQWQLTSVSTPELGQTTRAVPTVPPSGGTGLGTAPTAPGWQPQGTDPPTEDIDW